MEKNKTKTLTIIGIAVLVILLVGGTFAYFTAQGGGSTSRNVSVTSNTTDLLTFQVANDISFTASEANFYQGGSNVSGSTTASATLVPNNNTNQATMNYYMYLNLTSNPTVYSTGNTNEDAELVLQVFDGNNQLVTLTGLGDQVAIGSSYGYDITGKTGLITLLSNHAITANNATTIENWNVVITLINLNIDQNDNTNKIVTGEVIMSKSQINTYPPYLYWNDGFFGHTIQYNEIPSEEGIYGTFDTLNELITTNDASEYKVDTFECGPTYIKTTLENGLPVGHASCSYYDNTEFCLSGDYWVNAGNGVKTIESANATMNKLKSDLEDTYGITLNSEDCSVEYDNYNDYYGVSCSTDDMEYYIESTGYVKLYTLSCTSVNCIVDYNGAAWCYAG